MEGPSGGYRRRTAGERNDAAGGNRDGVRDWQRNTWYGPAPLHSNPFDEPEDAPELKDIRSENVNEHRGEFWAPHQAGYQPPAQAQPAAAPRQKEPRRRSRPGGARKKRPVLLVTLLLLAAAVLVLRFAVFTVTDIRVTGNVDIPAAEIIRISGIRHGSSILSLKDKDVERRITSDYRLKFDYLSKQMPHTVTIAVKEREPCCWMSYCGIFYEMDKNRMVLDESEDPTEKRDELVEIKGLMIRSSTMIGQTVTLGSEVQQSIFTELFVEMKVLGCTGIIREADISNTDSILLATRDGYTVSLGTRENLHAKLRSMMLVRDKLRELQLTGGTINVTNPEIPIYTP